jgi:hypothetical protein
MKLYNVFMANTAGQIVEGSVISNDEAGAYKEAYDKLLEIYIKDYEAKTKKKYKKGYGNEMEMRIKMIQEQPVGLSARGE